MQRQSYLSHLKSRTHRTNVSTGGGFEARVIAAEQAARVDEFEQELEFIRLRGLDVGSSMNSVHSRVIQGPSEVEKTMWDEYELNGADLAIADDPMEAAEVLARRRFERDVDDFGFWNPDAAG